MDSQIPIPYSLPAPGRPLGLQCRLPPTITRPLGRARSFMRLSVFFMPTLKENPSEAQIVSHRLMLRAGMVRQASAGIYSWLPLGFRVLKRIEQIVREEQDRADRKSTRLNSSH